MKRLWKWVFNLIIKCYQSCIWTDHWGEECLLDHMFKSFAFFRSFPVIDCSWSIVSGWLLLWYYCCHCLGNIECERRCVSICCSAFAKAGKKSKRCFFKSQSLVPFDDTFMGWNSSFSSSVSASFKIKLWAVSIVIIIKKGQKFLFWKGVACLCKCENEVIWEIYVPMYMQWDIMLDTAYLFVLEFWCDFLVISYLWSFFLVHSGYIFGVVHSEIHRVCLNDDGF